jgi:hypothetical protein
MADATPARRRLHRVPQQHWQHQILHQWHIAVDGDSFTVLSSFAIMLR